MGVFMKILVITASLLLSLSSLACDGSGKDKEKEEDKRVTSIR
jgi:hypothetical protein